jgi:uncharacterized protein YecT (DUF1311 family)
MAGRSSRPTLDDFGLNQHFGLKLSPSAKTIAYSFCSEPGEHFPGTTWAVAIGPDMLLVRDGWQVLLVMKRRPANARPSPSFDCSRSTNPTEMTVCKSFPLAAWDRSVALALKELTEGDPEHSEEVKKSQAQWIRKRNACGTDEKCIDASLEDRVEVLMEVNKTGRFETLWDSD